MISKELISAVFNEPIYEFKINGVDVLYKVGNKNKWQEKLINIYEFAHLVKEWINNQKYSFNICYRDGWWDRLEKIVHIDFYYNNKSFEADTEPEAIFKAGEWVLNNIKNDKQN